MQRGERAVGGDVQLGKLGSVQQERVRPAWSDRGGVARVRRVRPCEVGDMGTGTSGA